MAACAYGDRTCPCQDGDACHYRPTATTQARRPPREWWREVPCGHPPEARAWLGPDGPVCHCGCFLAGDVLPGILVSPSVDVRPEWPLAQCGRCGCYVGIPLESAPRSRATYRLKTTIARLLDCGR